MEFVLPTSQHVSAPSFLRWGATAALPPDSEATSSRPLGFQVTSQTLNDHMFGLANGTRAPRGSPSLMLATEPKEFEENTSIPSKPVLKTIINSKRSNSVKFIPNQNSCHRNMRTYELFVNQTYEREKRLQYKNYLQGTKSLTGSTEQNPS